MSIKIRPFKVFSVFKANSLITLNIIGNRQHYFQFIIYGKSIFPTLEFYSSKNKNIASRQESNNMEFALNVR